MKRLVRRLERKKQSAIFNQTSLYIYIYIYIYRYYVMTDVYTAALLPTKLSSDDDYWLRHGFGAKASLPLTQSSLAVTHDTTRLCWIDVTLCDWHFVKQSNKVYIYMCVCVCVCARYTEDNFIYSWIICNVKFFAFYIRPSSGMLICVVASSE